MNRIEINVLTGEQTIVPLTDAETATAQIQYETWNQQQIAENAAKEAQIATKASALDKLAALGLTQDEVKALVG